MQFKTKNNGFTLIELLTVISIMIILAGIVMPSLNRARLRAYTARSRAQIAALELALSMYESDIGAYPGNAANSQPIRADWLDNNAGTPGWDGPYMEFKDREIETAGSIRYVVDPWGQRYFYQFPGAHRTASFDLYSVGPDGQEGEHDGKNDDIANWTG